MVWGYQNGIVNSSRKLWLTEVNHGGKRQGCTFTVRLCVQARPWCRLTVEPLATKQTVYYFDLERV